MSKTFIFKVDTTEFKRWCNKTAQKQVHYAAATALTQTGVKAAEGLKSQLHKSFNLKKKSLASQYNPYPNKGMIKPANKQMALSKMFAEVGYPKRSRRGSLLPNMRWHVKGATKRPHKHKNIAIPMSNIKRRTKSNAPSTLLEKPNHFIYKNGSKQYIARRYKKKAPKLLYALRRSARIRETLPFNQVVHRAYSRHLRRNYIKAMHYAMKTAR